MWYIWLPSPAMCLPEVPSAGALQRGVPVHEGVEPRGDGAVLRGHQGSNESHVKRPSVGTEGQLWIPQSEIPQRSGSSACTDLNTLLKWIANEFIENYILFFSALLEYSRYLHSHLDIPVAEYNVDQDLPGNFKNHWAKNLPFLIEDYEEQPGLQPHIK